MVSWSKIERSVIVAINRGDAELLSRIIDKYPRVLTIARSSGNTLLHIAAEVGNIDIIQILVENGIDVNVAKYKECTPIHSAASKGSLEAVRWLTDHGANVNAGQGIHATALVSAADRGHLEIVKLLLESGADINADYHVGEGYSITRMNALKRAEMEGYNQIADYLRSHGCEEIDSNENLGKKIMDSRHDELIKHIEKHLGNIENTLGEVVPGSDVSVKINIVGLKEDKKYRVLVTTGMSDSSMDISGEAKGLEYAELLIKLPVDWPINREDFNDEKNYWPFGWLRQIAHIPHKYEGVLEEGVIIPNLEPPQPFSKNTKLSSLLVRRAKEDGLRICELSDGEKVNFYTIIPLYEEERQIAINKGVEYLMEVLDERGVSDVLDINRENVGIRK